jgi:hypothetical protein
LPARQLDAGDPDSIGHAGRIPPEIWKRTSPSKPRQRSTRDASA